MKSLFYQRGFSLVELMISVLLGIIISYSVLQVFLSQHQFYRTANSQSLILNTENSISNLITPTIRGAGFLGCGAAATGVSNLNIGAPDPLGSFNTMPGFIVGYNGSNTTFTITQTNASNDNNAADWSPSLPASLVGQALKGSDILITLGAMPGSSPITVTSIDSSSSSFNVLTTTDPNLSNGQLGAISDCVKSVIFQITGIGVSSITHASGSGSFQNSSDTFPVNFASGSQFIPIQQTAFFIGHGQGGQSSLMRGILGSSGWTIEPLVSGVEFMKIQYGIGDNGVITQYISANSVTDWTKVYAVRMGFLLSGKRGSASSLSTYNVLDTTVTVPTDTLLRHTYEITINLRNAI